MKENGEKKKRGRPKGSGSEKRKRIALAVRLRVDDLRREAQASGEEMELPQKPIIAALEALLAQDRSLLALNIIDYACGVDVESLNEGLRQHSASHDEGANGAPGTPRASMDVAYAQLTEREQDLVNAHVAGQLGIKMDGLMPAGFEKAVREISVRGGSCKAPSLTGQVRKAVAQPLSRSRMVDAMRQREERHADEAAEASLGDAAYIAREFHELSNHEGLGKHIPSIMWSEDDLESSKLDAACTDESAEVVLAKETTQASTRFRKLWERCRKAYRDLAQDNPGFLVLQPSVEVDPMTGATSTSLSAQGWPPEEIAKHPRPPVCQCPAQIGPHFHCEVCNAPFDPIGLPYFTCDESLRLTAEPAWTCTLVCWDEQRVSRRTDR